MLNWLYQRELRKVTERTYQKRYEDASRQETARLYVFLYLLLAINLVTLVLVRLK
jgi:hypothetical protein